jgi:predicted Zn-dependent protease
VEEALEELARAGREHPDSPDVHYALASLYQRLGRGEEAQAARARFQELNREAEEREHLSKRVAVEYKRARQLLEEGKLIEAESAFRAVLELDPENAVVCSMLAKIAFSKGDVAAANRWISEALENDDSLGEYYYLKAFFALRSEKLPDAELAVRRSLDLSPGYPDAWILLGSILVDSGRAEEAVDAFRKAEALEPSNATIQLNLASAYRASGKRREEEEAMERYRKLTSHQEVKP